MLNYYCILNAHSEMLFEFNGPGFQARLFRSRYEEAYFSHCEQHHRIFVTLAGGTRMTVAKTEGQPAIRRPDKPGSVTVVPAGVARDVTLSGGDMLLLTMSVACDLGHGGDGAGETAAPAHLLQNGRDGWLLRAAVTFAEARRKGLVKAEGDGLAMAVARHITRKSSPAGRHGFGLAPAALRRVLAMMHERVADDLSLHDMAREAGLSVSAFGRAFRRSIGVTPYRHLAALRMDEAKRLIVEGKLPLAAIAAAVGYSDQAHFTAAFCRHLGVSPARWRAQLGG